MICVALPLVLLARTLRTRTRTWDFMSVFKESLMTINTDLDFMALLVKWPVINLLPRPAAGLISANSIH